MIDHGCRVRAEPKTCERERAALLALWQEERFVPECSADGRYSPIQCHTATGYCWCVRVDTGRPLPGTSTRNRLPDCSPEESRSTHTTNTYRDRPLPGCPGSRKAVFLQSLVRALQLQAQQAGLLPAERSDIYTAAPSHSSTHTTAHETTSLCYASQSTSQNIFIADMAEKKRGSKKSIIMPP